MRFPSRVWLYFLAVICCPLLSKAEVQEISIDHDYVVTAAQKLAAQPYRAADDNLPSLLQNLSYDEFRRIRFIDEQSLWRADELPFRIQFFHPGNIHRRTVRIHEFAPGFSQRIPFVRGYFDYQDLNLGGRLPGSLEYAGFRALFRLNAPDRFDEVVSFLGASYYRALGRDHRYGMSARGLALNFGGPGAEEFPDFTTFWLGKPGRDAKSLTVHALLDSPSVAGAFTFVITPGEETVIRTHATLFFRKQVAVVGLAPLTSMYWFGENSPSEYGDFREEVHDSDGLLVAVDPVTRLWRPLNNPSHVRVTTFPATAGFGLLQRDNNYYNYEDPEARYEKRPGGWVRPIGQWPAGKVRLLELPTKDEYADNIVAAFVPDESPAAGASLNYEYEQSWTSRSTIGGPSAWVRATRRTTHVEQGPGRTLYVIDFDPAGLADVTPDAPVTADVKVAEPAQLLTQHLFRNDIDGSWRLTLLLDAPENSPPADISAQLLLDTQPLSELWTTTWEQ